MKQIKLTIGLALCALALTVSAQTNNSSGFLDRVGKVWDAAKDSGVLHATNYIFDSYATYAPDAPQKYGGGALVTYNLNQNVGLGIGVDYLGQLSLVSADLTLKLPTHPLDFLNPQWAKDTEFIWFAIGGTGKPLGGTGVEGVAVIADLGLAIRYKHFNVGGSWGHWINAGDYSGQRYHIFVGYSLLKN